MTKPISIPDLPTFLLWVAESYEAHAKTSDTPDEIDAYMGSAQMAREHLAALRAHNSDSAEPVAWKTERGEGEVAVHSLVVGGVLCRWWGDIEPEGVSILNIALASPPAKEVGADIIAQTIWNEHLFHADALVYGDKMITPDMAMAERLADLIVRSLTNRTPDDEAST